jgi:hypothetical protein
VGVEMNERIKELARRVVGKHRNDVSSISLFDEQIEKFAELIVRECSSIILNNDIEKQEDYGVNHLFFNGWERGVIDSCQVIKKHFGVEE